MPMWVPMFALPNITVRDAIEVDGFALVSLRDQRLQQLAQDQPAFQTYLSNFTNEFGDPVDPSIILWRDDAPERYRGVDAIAGFRDAIAMAVILYAWARVLRYDNNFGIKYADYFSVYP